MEKFFDWDSDFKDIGDDFDDCQREDLRAKARNYFSEKKETYSDTFSKLVNKGKEVLEDEEMKETLKILLCVLLFFILLCVLLSVFRRRR